MSLVIDASVMTSMLMPDETSVYAEQVNSLLESGRVTAWVAAHFHLEIANTLTMVVRRGRIAQNMADRAFSALGSFPFLVDLEAVSLPGAERIRSLAVAHNLTAYDAAYLELALRREAKLATLDAALSAAARQTGVFYQPAT